MLNNSTLQVRTGSRLLGQKILLFSVLQTTSEHFTMTTLLRHNVFIPQQFEVVKQRAARRSPGGLKRHLMLQLDAFAWCAPSYFGPGSSSGSPTTPHTVSTHFNKFTFLTKSGKTLSRNSAPPSRERHKYTQSRSALART